MKTKKKELYAYLIGAGAILSLVTVVLGASQKAMTTNYNFSTPLILGH